MGMAASQARLLSITARMSNNENTSESVSYSKQRLADQTQQITNEYNEALNTTKLTVLTGFNGSVANYEDISYNLMTGLQMAENTRQYFVTDTKGRVLVTEQIADAYNYSKGDYNKFLAKLGYSQSDLTVQISDRKFYDKVGNETTDMDKAVSQDSKTLAAEQQIHEAWDKYFATVGINKFMPEHDFGFSFIETYDLQTKDYFIGEGYVGYIRTDDNGNPIDKDGKWLYKKNEENKYIDSKNNIIKPDVYSDSVKNNKDNSLRYFDKNSNIVAYDVDTDGDNTNDSYSDTIKNNSDYLLRYADKDNKIVAYDDYSADAISNMVPLTDKLVYDPINYEGTTQESRNLYDYAMAITEAYLRVNVDGTSETGTPFKVEYDMSAIKSAANMDNSSALKYYRNIFDKIQASDFITYTDTPAKSINNDNYIYSETGKGTSKVAKNPLKDNYTFEAALRDGSLRLQYYSATKKEFISTTISEDNCIQEVPDERAIARAESKYNQDMADLENKDKKYDLELKKLDTEHKALETEYESVKNVVDKNVESSFKIFS